MHWLALGMALLLALAIIAIGLLYLVDQQTIMPGFGLPLPRDGGAIAPWLRPKGVRDIVAGLLVLAFMAWGDPRALGLVLLVLAIIPLGDMTVILTAKGSTRTAFGVHGVTALVMLATATALVSAAP